MFDENAQVLIYTVDSQTVEGETVTTNGVPVKITLGQLAAWIIAQVPPPETP